MTLLDQIRQTIARYRMLHPGDRLGLAVSGGADSLCLLYALFELRAEFGLTLSVIHIDHQLRGARSQADAQFVHNSAQQLSLPFHLHTLDLALQRGNLEQEARRARYQFFQRLIRDGVVDKVALGHTRSDQAETVLYRLLRGAGSAGLAGIRPVTDTGMIRPLLQVTRVHVEQWLNQREVVWREDETNAGLRFDRNRIRHQLLPRLEADWNPALGEILAQTADWAFEEEQYWREEIARLTAGAGNWLRISKNAAVVDVSRLNALPPAVARRLIREIVLQTKHDLLGVSFAHIEAIRRLTAAPEGDGRVQIPGLDVLRSFAWVRFSKSVEPPGRRESASPVRLERICNSGVYNMGVDALDWDKVGERAADSLVVRSWKPGDRYQPRGYDGPEKIKTLFQKHRIPLWERQDWPVITIDGAVAWAGLFGPAARYAVGPASRNILRIHWECPKFDEA